MISSFLELVTIDSSSQEQKQALFQSIKNYTMNMASSYAKCSCSGLGAFAIVVVVVLLWLLL